MKWVKGLLTSRAFELNLANNIVNMHAELRVANQSPFQSPKTICWCIWFMDKDASRLPSSVDNDISKRVDNIRSIETDRSLYVLLSLTAAI